MSILAAEGVSVVAELCGGERHSLWGDRLRKRWLWR
jgi:hypothetical protein